MTFVDFVKVREGLCCGQSYLEMQVWAAYNNSDQSDSGATASDMLASAVTHEVEVISGFW